MVKIVELRIGQVIKDEFDGITRELVKRYSKVGGFAKLASNPIHDNDKVAKEAGHKGVIAHGLFSFGFITKLLDEFIEREKHGKLITEATIEKIEGKRVHFNIKQKTITKIRIERDGEVIKKFEADDRNYISKKDYDKGYVKTKETKKGKLHYRERVNSPGYAIIELHE
ncbi:MAG: hypothetical protein EU548_03390 [Promethearchaeota archaeon]|nr:MAG: hypothetical protein EU548_03390 [Candidatus Lokiarchaeota archaeon]